MTSLGSTDWVLLLGGGWEALPLARSLERRGISFVVVDRDAECATRDVAPFFIELDVEQNPELLASALSRFYSNGPARIASNDYGLLAVQMCSNTWQGVGLSDGMLNFSHNKANIEASFNALGYRCPRHFSAENIVAEDFPVVGKTPWGFGGRGTQLLRSKEEMEAFRQMVGPRAVFQEFLEGFTAGRAIYQVRAGQTKALGIYNLCPGEVFGSHPTVTSNDSLSVNSQKTMSALVCDLIRIESRWTGLLAVDFLSNEQDDLVFLEATPAYPDALISAALRLGGAGEAVQIALDQPPQFHGYGQRAKSITSQRMELEPGELTDLLNEKGDGGRNEILWSTSEFRAVLRFDSIANSSGKHRAVLALRSNRHRQEGLDYSTIAGKLLSRGTEHLRMQRYLDEPHFIP